MQIPGAGKVGPAGCSVPKDLMSEWGFNLPWPRRAAVGGCVTMECRLWDSGSVTEASSLSPSTPCHRPNP